MATSLERQRRSNNVMNAEPCCADSFAFAQQCIITAPVITDVISLELISTMNLNSIRSFFSSLPNQPGEFDSLNFEQLPAASEALLASIESNLGFRIPVELRDFLLQTEALTFQYGWELPESLLPDAKELGLGDFIHGGGKIDGNCIFDDFNECQKYANESWLNDDEFREDQEIWKNTLPFLKMANGDYLGLDPKTHAVNYLSHDADSFRISSSFDDFLECWSLLGYIGPEHWILKPFLQNSRHLGPPSKEQKSAVERLFTTAR